VFHINSQTNFTSGYDPSTKAQTTANATQPSSPNAGDLWVDTDDEDKLYRFNGTSWVFFDLGLGRATANTGVSNAATAQAAANAAAVDATAANSELDDIADDSKVTPDEKNVAKRLYADITGEYAGVLAEGTEYAVSTSNYTTYYNALVTYITTVHTGSTNIFSTTNMELTTPINRLTWDSRWSNYYTHRQVLLNAIARKAKTDGVDLVAAKRTTFVDSIANDSDGQNGPVAIAVGDVWINGHTDSQKVYLCVSIAGTARVIGTNWILRDDAGAINNAETDINGGRIETQAILLKAGGSKVLATGTTHAGNSGTRILLSNTGIYAYNGSTAQFYLAASDGKGYFGGGAAILDSAGMHILTSSSSGAGDSTSGYLQFHYGTSASNAYGSTMTAALRATSATELSWIYGGSGNFVMNMNAFRLTTVGAINGGIDASSGTGASNYGFWRPPLMTSAASTGHVLTISGGSGTLASPYATTFSAVSGGGSGEANEYSFKTIVVSGETNVVADADDDTLTLVASGNMAITTSGDTITFNASGAAANHNHSSTYTTFAFQNIDIDNSASGYDAWGSGVAAAESINDTLYLVAGTNITLESDLIGTGTPAIRISASGGGGSGTVTSGDAGYVAYYPAAAATVDSRIAGGIEFISGTNIKLHGHTNLMSNSLKFE